MYMLKQDRLEQRFGAVDHFPERQPSFFYHIKQLGSGFPDQWAVKQYVFTRVLMDLAESALGSLNIDS